MEAKKARRGQKKNDIVISGLTIDTNDKGSKKRYRELHFNAFKRGRENGESF